MVRMVKHNPKGHTRVVSSSDGATRMDGAAVDDKSPVIQLFRQCQVQLDARHDKHERLVKLSRDTTIDSKRTIFLLHRAAGKEDEEVLCDAEQKLEAIQQGKWKTIALELHNEDPYQFLRAYSPGLQEYIEAVALYHYLKTSQLISLQQLETRLHFIHSKDLDDQNTAIPKEGVPSDPNQLPGSSNEQEVPPMAGVEGATMLHPTGELHVSVHIPPVEYLLGLADLTGELMRMAIHSVGCGNLQVPFELCNFMRTIHDAFVSFGNINRELSRKVHVLKQSLNKVEAACYTLQIRGSEMPRHMLADVLHSVGRTHHGVVPDDRLQED